ncbi:hypothetical protein [Colwellia sp. Arc7-D]|jgi:hypothetical protein|nr:hypothetical protein [Colwellia sp. Arc7-D]AWB57022.1 hypothetical protein DBO93_05275 [Colwellia sp. Arc7-D]|tara:strand:- start:2217 stop:2609 length:393 start_codon:yes stop_codon:yes gene_type:complete
MVEHGNYSVTLEVNLLSIILVGTFNDIATKSACKQIQTKVDSLNGQAFSVLLNCTNYEGSTPAAHKISNDYFLWLNKQNCIAWAAIYHQKIYADMAKNQQPAMFEFQNRREFYDVESAKSWLASQSVVIS